MFLSGFSPTTRQTFKTYNFNPLEPRPPAKYGSTPHQKSYGTRQCTFGTIVTTPFMQLMAKQKIVTLACVNMRVTYHFQRIMSGLPRRFQFIYFLIHTLLSHTVCQRFFWIYVNPSARKCSKLRPSKKQHLINTYQLLLSLILITRLIPALSKF